MPKLGSKSTLFRVVFGDISIIEQIIDPWARPDSRPKTTSMGRRSTPTIAINTFLKMFTKRFGFDWIGLRRDETAQIQTCHWVWRFDWVGFDFEKTRTTETTKQKTHLQAHLLAQHEDNEKIQNYFKTADLNLLTKREIVVQVNLIPSLFDFQFRNPNADTTCSAFLQLYI